MTEAAGPREVIRSAMRIERARRGFEAGKRINEQRSGRQGRSVAFLGPLRCFIEPCVQDLAPLLEAPVPDDDFLTVDDEGRRPTDPRR